MWLLKGLKHIAKTDWLLFTLGMVVLGFSGYVTYLDGAYFTALLFVLMSPLYIVTCAFMKSIGYKDVHDGD